MSDKALLEKIGTYIKEARLNRNLTQEDVAKAANISRSTLSLLERGEVVTLMTMIQVLRVLDVLHVLQVFEVEKQISPMQLAEEDRNKRFRASRKKPPTNEEGEW